MDVLKEYLPQGQGFLPHYMFTLSVIAVGNSLQNYITLHFSRRFYNGQFIPNPSLPPKITTVNPEDSTKKLIPATASNTPKDAATMDQVTPLAARLFGTYTLISAIVRLYASFHLDKEPVYMMAMWTYLVALGHFVSEGAVYKTYYLGGPQLMPLFFATTGVAWMIMQKEFYVVA
ncbi:Erg28 protein [Pseudomassariella vexata]|uniref:Erg28 protein n=1 Tax=Pseudomassariella vexata TaxID=1141098 RepID=A0A1Y2DG06_9PEZI|nr:Erg28 protein [Pseudomassariella vexata]ORY58198.1 Erg28 protein [Pseudomassariella vexata]